MSHATNGHGPSLAVDLLDGLVASSVGSSRHVGEEDWRRYEGYVAEILGSFGLDLSTPGTADTPRRFLRVAVADAARVPTEALIDLLRERGFELVLSEGGPTLVGELLAARAVDELFLTVAPQVAGRSERAERLGLVEGVGFPPEFAPWAHLRSVMRSQDHLFLRYVLDGTDRMDVGAFANPSVPIDEMASSPSL